MVRDAEGNGYSPLYGWWEAVYVHDEGEVYPRSLSDDMAAGWSEEDLYDGDDGILAIVLTPR